MSEPGIAGARFRRDRRGSPDIAIFLPSLRGGGAERVMATLASAFAAAGRRVELVLVKAEGPYLSEIPSNVTVVDFNRTRTYFALLDLVLYLYRRRPGSLLSTLTHANIIAWMARRLYLLPIRLVVREANTYSQAHVKDSWRRRKLIPLLMRMCYSSAGAVVAVSSGVKLDLVAQGVPEDNIHVVYNPTATPEIPELAGLAAEHPFYRGHAHKNLLAVGRLTKQKDHQTLLSALVLIRKRLDAKLLILGEGPLRKELEEAVHRLGLSEHVSLPGFEENPFRYMKRADVFVLSSKWEGLPNTLIQAMACGSPVVSTDCPSGPSEILEGGKWGRLVPPGEATALAEAVMATLSEEYPPNVSNRAADFGLERSTSQYLRLLGYG